MKAPLYSEQRIAESGQSRELCWGNNLERELHLQLNAIAYSIIQIDQRHLVNALASILLGCHGDIQLPSSGTGRSGIVGHEWWTTLSICLGGYSHERGKQGENTESQCQASEPASRLLSTVPR